jgi:hypothetical protein
MEDDEMVQTFPSDRANETLAIGILPRGMRSGEHLLNPHRMAGCRELLTINSIAIAQQVACALSQGKAWTSCRPSILRWGERLRQSEGVGGDHETEPEKRRADGKSPWEPLGMIFQEGPPGLRGWLAVANHVFGNRRWREVDAEFLEFSMNARRTPTWDS